jgi:hypothetical protein
MSNTKFPKFLYVKEEISDINTGETYLLADADPTVHAELNARITVAKYQFIEQGEVSACADYIGDDE